MSRIRDAFDIVIGRKEYRAPRTLSGEVALADPLQLFNKFESYNPSTLVSRKGLNVFDSMRKDEQVKASLNFKKNAVLSSGWEIQSPEAQDTDWEVTRFVREQLTHLDCSLDTCLLEIMSALDYGYSVTEKIYGDVEDGEFRGLVSLRGLKTKKPHFFDFATDKFGNLKPDGILQEDEKGGRTPLPVEKFVLYSFQKEFSNPYGKSDLESIYRPWWHKDLAVKWLQMLLERHGIPPVFGLYNPDHYTNDQKEDLKTVIKRLQAATMGIIPRPEKDDLEMWTPNLADNTQRVFIPALEMFDTMISRGLLMPGLLGLTPEKRVGSLARARVQFDVFVLVVEHIQKEIEETVMFDQVIKQLVDLNFSVTDYPRFRFLPMTDQRRVDLLEAWAKQVEVGTVKLQGDDEKHIRRVLDLPPREATDEEFEDVPEDGQVETPESFAVQNRKKSAAEKQINFQEIENDLDQQEAQAVERLVPFLKRGVSRLKQKLRRQENSLRFIKSVNLQVKNNVNREFRKVVEETLTVGRRQLRTEIGKPKKFQDEPSFVPENAIQFIKERALLFAGGLTTSLETDIKNALSLSLRNGEGTREAIRRLDEAVAPYVGSELTPEDVQPHKLERLVRTQITEAINLGRVVEARDPEIEEFMRGMEYSAILDSRTTQICRHLDGKFFELNDPDMDRFAPPNHFNCRSVLVPVTIGIDPGELNPITDSQKGRASELAGDGFV